VVAITIFIVHTYILASFVVPSGSMIPTLEIGQHILVDKTAYWFHDVNRGDVVVLHAPSNLARACGSGTDAYLVKRVVAVGGDEIFSKGNTVYVDGVPSPVTWSSSKNYSLGKPIPWTKVPPGDIYLLGDNRSVSCDSRYWGPVPQSSVVGQVIFVTWPLSQMHIVN
jgi:signal peptidase I